MKHILAASLLAGAVTAAQPALADHIKVMAGGSLNGAFAELVPQFERASGHTVEVSYGSINGMIKRAATGPAFDVAIAPHAVLHDNSVAAKFAPGAVRIGGVGYGVAVRAGAPKPDVSTPAAFKDTMLKAKSITYFAGTPSAAYVDSVFTRLGIDEVMKAKTNRQPNPAKVVQAIVNGDAELGVFLINVFATPGIDIVGPFAAELQNELVFEGALAADTKSAAAGKAFIEFLRTPEAAAVFKVKGMSPG